MASSSNDVASKCLIPTTALHSNNTVRTKTSLCRARRSSKNVPAWRPSRNGGSLLAFLFRAVFTVMGPPQHHQPYCWYTTTVYVCWMMTFDAYRMHEFRHLDERGGYLCTA